MAWHASFHPRSLLTSVNKTNLLESYLHDPKTCARFGIHGVEDIIHEIYTVGPNFKQVRLVLGQTIVSAKYVFLCFSQLTCWFQVSNFLWPFKLSSPKGGFINKRHGFCEARGGDWGNREALLIIKRRWVHRFFPIHLIEASSKFFFASCSSHTFDCPTCSSNCVFFLLEFENCRKTRRIGRAMKSASSDVMAKSKKSSVSTQNYHELPLINLRILPRQTVKWQRQELINDLLRRMN